MPRPRKQNFLEDFLTEKLPHYTFFCLDEERDIFVGAVNIRHYLNDSLLLNGGHIGDGVRPSERKKGVATKMIALALEECKKIECYAKAFGRTQCKYNRFE